MAPYQCGVATAFDRRLRQRTLARSFTACLQAAAALCVTYAASLLQHATTLFDGDNVRNVAALSYSADSRSLAFGRAPASTVPPYFEMEIDMISNIPVIVCHQ